MLQELPRLRLSLFRPVCNAARCSYSIPKRLPFDVDLVGDVIYIPEPERTGQSMYIQACLFHAESLLSLCGRLLFLGARGSGLGTLA